jgi:hypothetical protein
MNGRAAKDYVLENLLGYDGRTHHFEKGYWLKFEFKRVPETSQRLHGLDYSLTLHAPDGTRLLGFDNAHPVPAKGSRFKKPPQQSDHWHRTETDPPDGLTNTRTPRNWLRIFLMKRNEFWPSAEFQQRSSVKSDRGVKDDEQAENSIAGIVA